MLTNEELDKEIRNISESIDNLPEADDPLTKEEKKHRLVLKLKKETLERIKEAREKSRRNDEIYNMMVYAMLTSWGARHPYLMALVATRMRWNCI